MRYLTLVLCLLMSSVLVFGAVRGWPLNPNFFIGWLFPSIMLYATIRIWKAKVFVSQTMTKQQSNRRSVKEMK
jgi:hypothetical protein